MSRYIDAERIHPALFNIYKAVTSRIARKTIEKCDYELSLIPAADVAPVVHAHWINRNILLNPVCSVCKRFADSAYKTPFCAYCGAKMDEKENEK